MQVLPNNQMATMQIFFSHYHRFIEKKFVRLHPRTSLAKRWIILAQQNPFFSKNK